jgi:hypothetical protein
MSVLLSFKWRKSYLGISLDTYLISANPLFHFQCCQTIEIFVPNIFPILFGNSAAARKTDNTYPESANPGEN